MTRVGLRAVWLLASFIGAVSACEGREIIVFAPAQAGAAGLAGLGGVPSAGSAGTAGSGAGSPGGVGNGGDAGSGGGDPCQAKSDCDPSWYCAKQTCNDQGGYCLPIPIADDPQLMPVCGCEDGITYWNDTLRRAFGVSASMPGACQLTAQSCFSGLDCGPDGSCSQQLPDVSFCGNPGKGQCWIIPDDCAGTDGRPVGLPCPPPGPPGPGPKCLSLCEALQAGRPYVKKPKDYHCP